MLTLEQLKEAQKYVKECHFRCQHSFCPDTCARHLLEMAIAEEISKDSKADGRVPYDSGVGYDFSQDSCGFGKAS